MGQEAVRYAFRTDGNVIKLGDLSYKKTDCECLNSHGDEERETQRHVQENVLYKRATECTSHTGGYALNIILSFHTYLYLQHSLS